MHRKGMLLCLLGVAVAVLGFDAPTAFAQVSPRRIVIAAKRFSFEPSEITLKKGQPVVIVLKSEDVPHGLRVRDLDFQVKVSAGGTAEAQFTPQKTGDFVGQCYVFCGKGHGSMAMTIHVVD